MAATLENIKKRIVYKPGRNNVWLQLPDFWVGYVMALWDGVAPRHVSIDMDKQGVLTITPIKEENANAEQKVPCSDS